MRPDGEPERMAGMTWARFADLIFVFGAGWLLRGALEARRAGNKDKAQFPELLIIGLLWLGLGAFEFWPGR